MLIVLTGRESGEAWQSQDWPEEAKHHWKTNSWKVQSLNITRVLTLNTRIDLETSWNTHAKKRNTLSAQVSRLWEPVLDARASSPSSRYIFFLVLCPLFSPLIFFPLPLDNDLSLVFPFLFPLPQPRKRASRSLPPLFVPAVLAPHRIASFANLAGEEPVERCCF